jgi:hypothetical protein
MNVGGVFGTAVIVIEYVVESKPSLSATKTVAVVPEKAKVGAISR